MTKFQLMCSSACLALLASPAAAQTTTVDASSPSRTDGSEPAGDIVVTGSRIKGTAPVGSTVLTVNRDAIEATGATTTAELLAQLPQVNNLGISESSRTSTGGALNATYAQGINIHGIGQAATLILLDGRRVVPQGIAGSISDTSIVPTIALERIEVVPDGASAIYGSDAVAGVANFVLRRHFSGVEASARYGFADDYNERQVGIIAGHDWGSGHFTIAYGYTGHSALRSSDRSFSTSADLRSRGGLDFRSTSCNPGNIIANGLSYAIPAGGITPANAGLLVPNTVNRCEVYSNADLLPSIERHSIVATFDQKLTDGLSLFATALGTKRDVDRRFGVTTASLSVPATNAFYVTPVAGSPRETVSYAFTELPSNDITGYGNVLQLTGGIKAKLPFHWNAELAYTYGWARDKYLQDRGINPATLAAALASSDPATAFNPFGGPNSPALLSSIGNAVQSFRGLINQGVVDFGLDGPLFRLPGGPVRLALGYQNIRNHTKSLTMLGSTVAPLPGVSFDFTRKVNSAYAELLIPIFGPDNAVPGIRSLQVDVAGRYDHYNDAGSTKNPKVGVTWKPIDGLSIRGSYGTSFRAPSLVSSKSAPTITVFPYPDPLLGGGTVQAIQISGGGLQLKPETATTYSFGVELDPVLIPGFHFSASYFNVNYKNIVAGLAGNSQILNQASFYSELITRNPTPEQVADVLSKYQLLSGVVPSPVPVIVDVRSRNLGVVKTSGLDIFGSYTLRTESAGNFTVGANATYFLGYKAAPAPTAPLVDQLSNILYPVRFQGRANLGWDRGAFNAIGYLNFTGKYKNNLVTPAERVGSYATIDLHVGYKIENLGPAKGLRLGLDVANLFDRDPPFVNIAPSTSGAGGYDGTLASPIGRTISLSLTADF